QPAGPAAVLVLLFLRSHAVFLSCPRRQFRPRSGPGERVQGGGNGTGVSAGRRTDVRRVPARGEETLTQEALGHRPHEGIVDGRRWAARAGLRGRGGQLGGGPGEAGSCAYGKYKRRDDCPAVRGPISAWRCYFVSGRPGPSCQGNGVTTSTGLVETFSPRMP